MAFSTLIINKGHKVVTAYHMKNNFVLLFFANPTDRTKVWSVEKNTNEKTFFNIGKFLY